MSAPQADAHFAPGEEAQDPTNEVGVHIALLRALQEQMVVHRVEGPAEVHKDSGRLRCFTGARGLHLCAQPQQDIRGAHPRAETSLVYGCGMVLEAAMEDPLHELCDGAGQSNRTI